MYGVNAYGVNPYGINKPATVAGAAVFASAFSCSSAVTANLKLDVKLASNLSAISQLTANLTKPALILESDLIAVSTLTAALRKGVLLQSDLINTTTIASNLVKPANGFASVLVSESSLVGALKTGVLFEASLASSSTLSGDFSKPPAVLESAFSSSSFASSNLVVYKFVGSNLSAATSLQANLSVNKNLGSAFQSASVLNAQLRTGVNFASSFSTQTTIAGSLQTAANVYLSSDIKSQTNLVCNLQTEVGDPLWANVVSLLKLNGGVVDETGRNWVTTGTPVYGDTGKFGTAVRLDPGASFSSAGSHGIGLDDFTVEFFFKPPATGSQQLFYFSNGLGVYTGIEGGQPYALLWNINSNAYRHSSPISTTAFTHCAFVKNGSTYSLWINGTQADPVNPGAIRDLTGTTLSIGKYPLSATTSNGVLMDEFRITKGVARYTAPFTPPSKEFAAYAVVIPTITLEAALSSISTVAASLTKPILFGASLNSNSALVANLLQSKVFASALQSVSSLTSNLKIGSTFEASLFSVTTVNGNLVQSLYLRSSLLSNSALTANLKESSIAGWDSPLVMFNEARTIYEMSLTFDQLGRPLVFYRVNNDDLYLYWFNPTTSVNESRYMGKGISPVAGFDIVDNTSDADSDAMIFYVRNDTAYMRIQRESWGTEHNTGVNKPNLKLSSSGMRIDNRFQVIYSYSGAPQIEYTPDNPGGYQPPGDGEPPIDPNDPGLPGNQTPIDADYAYKNVGLYSGSIAVAEDVRINGRDSFSFGFKIVALGSGQNISGLRSYFIFGADTYDGFSRNLYGAAYISDQYNLTIFKIWRATSSFAYNLEVKNLTDLVGEWKFEFIGTRVKMYLNGELKAEDWFSNYGDFSESTRLTFGGVRSVNRSNSIQPGPVKSSSFAFDGALRDCWIDHPNYGKLLWPMNEYDSSTQNTSPVSQYPLEIENHKTTNWILVPE